MATKYFEQNEENKSEEITRILMIAEKLAKKEFRQLKLTSCTLKDTGSQAFVVAEHILNSLERELPPGEEVIPLCKEEIACILLEEFLAGREGSFDKKYWLTSTTHHDLQNYAKKYDLELRELTCNKDTLKLLEEVGDKEHTLAALRKSFEWIQENLEKKNE